MKSVGEVMAIGRTFKESFQKALRGLEIGVAGLDPVMPSDLAADEFSQMLERELREASDQRLWYVGDAFRSGLDVNAVFEITKIDPWFLSQIHELIASELSLKGKDLHSLDALNQHCLSLLKL